MKILWNERAVYLEDISAVIITDLHIGYEDELRERGIIVPSQWKSMRNRIEDIMEKTEADRLIILGDIKHSILSTPRYVREFFEDMPYEIMAVKGNHDGGIEEMVDFKVYPSQGFRIGKYGFIHGHSWLSEEVVKADFLFMGHMHPEIELFDSLRKSNKMACFLYGNLNEKGIEKYGRDMAILILPAFNPLVGAAIGKPLGPLFTNDLVTSMEIYLLNGTYLGKYKISQSQAQDL